MTGVGSRSSRSEQLQYLMQNRVVILVVSVFVEV